ncbi:MAG: CoA transferase subunit A [Chloroflexota bacterium]
MEVLAEGEKPFLRPDPDGFRAWVAAHKRRDLVEKLIDEAEAVRRLVADGDYLVYDCNYLQRGPNSLLREVIRQRKRNLWVGGKFTWVDAGLLVAGGVVGRIDVGFIGPWRDQWRRVREHGIPCYEWGNLGMTVRLLAGAMGVPFLPVRFLGGTDSFYQTGAKVVRDPFTGEAVTLIPALNPDVALIHVHQADRYGNARVFGTGIAHLECALASKKVILSAEEIIDHEEFRRNPQRTTIPYFLVDAVVHAPFGGYPGEVQGYYAGDIDHFNELIGALEGFQMEDYLEKWVYSVGSDREMLEVRVGLKKLLALKSRAQVREGYR